MAASRRIALPALGIVLGLMMLFPIYMMVISSMRSETTVFDFNLLPTEFVWSNFTQAWTGSGLPRSILNSLFVSTTVTVVAMVFHAMSGYALARFKFPGKSFVFAWMLSTLMVPFSIIMLPLYLITRDLGMVNSYWGLIVPSIFNAYGIFLFRQFYRDFPKELEEAAYIEGQSLAGTFFRIAFPLSVPIIVPLTIGFFLANWNAYLWPLVVITDNEKLWVVQLVLAHLVGGGYFTPWNIVLAAAVIAALPTFILFFAAQRYLVEGIKMSGIK